MMQSEHAILIASSSEGIRAELRQIFQNEYQIIEARTQDQIQLIFADCPGQVSVFILDCSQDGSFTPEELPVPLTELLMYFLPTSSSRSVSSFPLPYLGL